MFYWPSPRYVVEEIQKFGPNVVGFHLATGEWQWYIVGFYLAPDDTLTIDGVIAALNERPRGDKLLVEGDLNINMEEPEGYCREEEIVAALITAGLEDMLAHFLP